MDGDTAPPDGVDNTLELVSEDDVHLPFAQALVAQDPTILNDAIASTFAENSVPYAPADIPEALYITKLGLPFVHLGRALELSPDGTGAQVDEVGKLDLFWSINLDGHLVLDLIGAPAREHVIQDPDPIRVIDRQIRISLVRGDDGAAAD